MAQTEALLPAHHTNVHVRSGRGLQLCCILSPVVVHSRTAQAFLCTIGKLSTKSEQDTVSAAPAA